MSFFGGASAGLVIGPNMNIALRPISNRYFLVGRLLGQLTRVMNEHHLIQRRDNCGTVELKTQEILISVTMV